MREDLVIIKLGGSVITDKKSGKAIYRKNSARKLVREISHIKDLNKLNIIIVHGAGSFAHPIAKKYQLDKGYLGAESVKGFALCKQAMFELNLLVSSELMEAGINASCVQPSSIIKATDGKIRTLDLRFIKQLLAKNLVPVLFGDVVMDSKRGFSVISGDQMVAYLAKKLGAKLVIFCSDVDGVFDKNPKIYKDARLIKKVNNSNYRGVIRKMESYNKSDVTGEMKGKILEIKKNLPRRRIYLISGFSEGNLSALLNGKSIGTLFEFV